jgi:hypothetical protein
VILGRGAALTWRGASPRSSRNADSAGEIGPILKGEIPKDQVGAEGATAPETLRQMDRAASIA